MMKTMRRLLGSLAVAAFPLSAWAGIHVQQNDPYLNIGSMTVTGGGGVNVTYGVVAATFTGNGSALTGITIGLPLPAGATNYINAGSLLTGATFYVSSGTVTGQLSPATIKWPDGTIQVSSPPVSVTLTATQTFTGANTFSTPGPSTFTYGVTLGSVTLTNVASGVQCLHANGSGQVTGSGSDCASTAGFVSLTATQTVSGGNTFTTPGQSTFTYGIVTGSITLTGLGAGGWQFTEGFDTSTFSPTSTKDNLWASVSSHSLVTNYNASTSSGVLVNSTFSIVGGHYLTSSGLGLIGDGGTTSTVPQGPSQSVQYNNAGTLAGSSKFQFNGTSVTVTSSVTFNTGNGDNNIPALINIYDGNSYSGKTLFNVGSQNALSEFYIQDGQPLTDNFGFVGNRVVMGAAAYQDSIYDQAAILNQIILSSGNSSGTGVPGEMDLQTTSDKGQPIVFLPSLVKTMTISSEAVTISTLTAIVVSAKGAYALTVSTTASNYQIAVTTTGHVSSYGVLPSTSSCGTGAGFTGTDVTGIITPGSAANGCTVTFAKPYKNTPSCIVEEQTLSLVNALSWTVSTTALVISQTSLTSKVNYICTGINE